MEAGQTENGIRKELRIMVLTVTLKEGAREMVEDDASRDTVIPTAHGQARMSERAVSIEELQRAKMYGTIRAGDRGARGNSGLSRVSGANPDAGRPFPGPF